MPEGMDIPPLDKMDHRHFEALTAQESFSIDGQRKKMEMIEKMIWERWKVGWQRVRTELMERELRGELLREELDRRVQMISVSRLPLGDGRFNLIVEKRGRRTSREKKPLSIMVPAHVDTVNASEHLLELRTDVADADRYTGRGVYDMGAGVLNAMYLAAEVDVPDDMTAYFIFTVDEEKDSKGVKALIQEWKAWQDIDIVISNEIGPDETKRPPTGRVIHTGRRGRGKWLGTIDVHKRGHQAKRGVPNSSEALIEVLGKVKQRFYEGKLSADPGQVVERIEPPIQLKHDLLEEEILEFGELKSMKPFPGYVPPSAAGFDLSAQLVPGSDRDEEGRPITRVEAVYRQIKKVFQEIAKAGKWEDFQIDWTFIRNLTETSYEPYAMPANHPVSRIVREIYERVANVMVSETGATSVADECELAESMLERLPNNTFEGNIAGVISLPTEGGEAHNDDEWVSKRSIAEVRHIMRLLIEDPDGFRLLIGA